MDNHELTVHGSIFFLLKNFVAKEFSFDTWYQLNESAGTRANYQITQNYPLEEMNAIVGEASKATGKSVEDLKEQFGEFLVPDLFKLYASYLNPDWKTYEVLLNTERVMHGAVRHLNSTANPPVLNVTTVNAKTLMIDYYSRRKMGSLAIGIIRGIADYFEEKDIINIIPLSDPEDERVQIRIEFLN